ncbi:MULTISPECIES: YeiH family protein [unclassified Paenibacillus]|uniref:YeiH family protein n=1 Tax=unclassified Paenibacillus TaxID=185978 RepID=UPI001AEADDF7|nr:MULTISPECIES: YeiH family protein [unclassified Paenibacillus]MBP1156644.1 putative integral membrane protein (TIGR00698 family) [Paenibacillus sp. PvP091]MBP1172618.1 putative integral membrane protein (TIGR00698 family) [Paenibacillus sp. PvR098]MBP2438998.1 putative integral membrane protein (TIGR00698 family) [Paenibacillus sp. PvP052]
MAQAYALPLKRGFDFIQGMGLTLLLALSAKYVSGIPFLSILGQLVIAILLGMIWRAVIGIRDENLAGISFSSKTLLRCGIVLLGLRLNLLDILHAGPKVMVIVFTVVIFTLFVVYGITKCFKIQTRLGMLTACGTAICGAAAVVAISPQMKARNDETAISAATVAILGTIFTLMYTLLYPVLGLTPVGYGVFAGATLHEVAHVIAAAAPGGKEAEDMAVIVKLSRVAMLVPVAMIIGFWANRLENTGQDKSQKMNWKSIPIPWFIFGFIIMSGVNTLNWIPLAITNQLITIAYLLIAMAMAGLGLNVDLVTFRRLGMKPLAAGFIGSVLLAGLGWVLVHYFGLA